MRLTSLRVEIYREDEIAMLRGKLKKLENPIDLEVIEAEYNACAEAESNDVGEGAEVGNTLHAGESSIRTNEPSSQTPQIASTSIQTKTNLNLREDSFVQALKQSSLISKLPTLEPFVFTGDLKFIEWNAIFKTLIETGCKSSAYKLFYF